jgi:hypothetical protein
MIIYLLPSHLSTQAESKHAYGTRVDSHLEDLVHPLSEIRGTAGVF